MFLTSCWHILRRNFVLHPMWKYGEKNTGSSLQIGKQRSSNLAIPAFPGLSERILLLLCNREQLLFISPQHVWLTLLEFLCVGDEPQLSDRIYCQLSHPARFPSKMATR